MSPVENPILAGCHPDPSICRVGDDYYLITSTFEYLPGLPVFHSSDLASWELVGHAVTDQLDFGGIASSGGLYAPTIRHHDGLFWVVCTLVDPGDPSRGGNFLLTAGDPSGPWSEPVWLEADGIDPSIFFDDDGRCWLHGTRLAAEPAWHDQTEVWLREYDPRGRCLVGPEHILWRGALLGAVWAEGPHLYKVDGSYYLLAAEGGTEFHHAVCVARAEAVTGPYRGNPSNPVLTHRHLGRGVDVIGAGHADLVQAPDGSWWAVLLAMRTGDGVHYELGRETFLVGVEWQDGWPVFAPGQGRIPATVEVPWDVPDEPTPEQGGRGGGLVPPTDPRWTSLRGLPDGFATPRGDGWRLVATGDSITDPGTPAFLGLRQAHHELDFEVSLIASGTPGSEAGLIIRQSEADHVRLALVPGVGGAIDAVAVHRQAGVEHVVAEAGGVTLPGESVALGVRVRDHGYHLWIGGTPGGAQLAGAAASTPSGGVELAEVAAWTLDSVATGGFLGVWLGVYLTGEPGTVLEAERVLYVPRSGGHAAE